MRAGGNAAAQGGLLQLAAWQRLASAGTCSYLPAIARFRQKLLTLKPSVGVFLEGQEEAAFKCKGGWEGRACQ